MSCLRHGPPPSETLELLVSLWVYEYPYCVLGIVHLCEHAYGHFPGGGYVAVIQFREGQSSPHILTLALMVSLQSVRTMCKVPMA